MSEESSNDGSVQEKVSVWKHLNMEDPEEQGEVLFPVAIVVGGLAAVAAAAPLLVYTASTGFATNNTNAAYSDYLVAIIALILIIIMLVVTLVYAGGFYLGRERVDRLVKEGTCRELNVKELVEQAHQMFYVAMGVMVVAFVGGLFTIGATVDLYYTQGAQIDEATISSESINSFVITSLVFSSVTVVASLAIIAVAIDGVVKRKERDEQMLKAL